MAPASTPLQQALKAMFDLALSSSCRDRAIWLINQPQARGGPEKDDGWVFQKLSEMLSGAGKTAFVRKQAMLADQALKE